ncbi:MAG: beta-galactosidase, partial [Exilibacterium sp.]
MISRGGPIILTQVENEYGSYGSDHSYMRAIHRILQKAGFDGIFYTADGAAVMQGGILPGLIPAINFGTYAQARAEFTKRLEIRPDGPLICGELWGGWFDHFGETHANMPIEPLIESLKWMLDNQCSFSFYMLHGGTSFGFSAGANFQPDSHFAPDISSYDYDAILDEAGRPTAKYHAVKKLFQKYIPSKNFPPLPNPEKAIHIPRFKLTESAPLHQLASQAIPAEEPQTLEALGHTHGLMLYRSRQELTLTG